MPHMNVDGLSFQNVKKVPLFPFRYADIMNSKSPFFAMQKGHMHVFPYIYSTQLAHLYYTF